MTFGGVRHGADIRADDQTKESDAVIQLQSGTNKFASQKGMVMGGVRHGADIRYRKTDPHKLPLTLPPILPLSLTLPHPHSAPVGN